MIFIWCDGLGSQGEVNCVPAFHRDASPYVCGVRRRLCGPIWRSSVFKNVWVCARAYGLVVIVEQELLAVFRFHQQLIGRKVYGVAA